MSSYSDYFNAGIDAMAGAFNAPFSMNGNQYKGVFNVQEVGSFLESGGFLSRLDTTLTVLKRDLGYKIPQKGVIIVKLPWDNDPSSTTFQIDSVGNDSFTYTIKLTDINK